MHLIDTLIPYYIAHSQSHDLLQQNQSWKYWKHHSPLYLFVPFTLAAKCLHILNHPPSFHPPHHKHFQGLLQAIYLHKARSDPLQTCAKPLSSSWLILKPPMQHTLSSVKTQKYTILKCHLEESTQMRPTFQATGFWMYFESLGCY